MLFIEIISNILILHFKPCKIKLKANGSKLGYNSCPLFTILTVQRHWKIHFLLTLHSKFCKEK
jgi:hypothetical protein